MQSNQNELGNHLKAKDIPNLTVLGKAIKKLKWRKSKVNGTRGYLGCIVTTIFLIVLKTLQLFTAL